MASIYVVPNCLRSQRINPKTFGRWLHRKALALVRRDKRHGNSRAKVAAYKKAILQAINETKGVDYYTGEALHWHRISQWNNAKAALGRIEYKRIFWSLPTIDHEDPLDVDSPLRLCSWRVNDSKCEQNIKEFLELADRIRAYLRRRRRPIPRREQVRDNRQA